ncbi:MAG: c-type cytochrome [Verrucomicrobiales bacterium]|nr:c-type cytochrome [Verrucomicrobiales bacterium]
MRRLSFILLTCFCASVWSDETSKNPVPLQEAYDSWKLAKDGVKTSPATIYAPDGFRVELIKAATKEEGSWVSMCFDDKDRLYIAIEKQGILRLTFGDKGIQTELVDNELLECRGLLWAYDSLYANANNSKGLYRLEDTDGDDKLDRKTLLLKTEGGVGHGRNHLRLGPDGLIYIVHGNDVLQAREIEKNSPHRNYEEDQLIPNPWDDDWFNRKAFVPAGHILRMDKDGNHIEMIAGGLRNPLDIDFNADGEPFVYEADMEWESALAWYKPTRVLHIVSGGDYGWRRATGKWPAYYEDSLPAAYDVGLGSPTGVEFGYRSHFPDEWKNALFIADWSYGRIIATRLAPAGASYTGEGETFILGRPLNVTDLTFSTDGAMYFITGGRRTQSALYRVSWTGEPNTGKPKPQNNSLIDLRRSLERWHTEKGIEGVALAKANLKHDDRWIRFAARVALENQFPHLWIDWAKAGDSPLAVMALARLRLATTTDLVTQLAKIPFENDSINLVRAYHLAFARCGEPDEITRQKAITHLSPHFPSERTELNHELCELLVYLKAPDTMERTLSLLDAATTTEDLSQYLSFSRYLFETVPCTVEECTGYNRRFLKGLRRMENFPGGRWYERTITKLQEETEARLTDDQKTQLSELLKRKEKPMPQVTGDAAKLVNEWRMADFDEAIERPLENRDLENGKKAFIKGQCAVCHRIDGIPTTPQQQLGPDLSGLGSRFGIADMLESIIHPSRVIGDKYRNPAGPNISLMPPGLINTLDRESVLDLLSFMQSGNPTPLPE